jgi:quercetin dioxygenase-like cupin family protein
VTVISGTFRLGMGETADPGKAQALPAGSLIVLPPQMAHFALADEFEFGLLGVVMRRGRVRR